MHVLILGARAPACLEWARAFRTANWRVSVADSLVWPVTRASRAIHDYFRLPEPRHDPDDWIEALGRIVDAHAVDLILPTCEEAFYLAYGRDRLPCRVATSDFDLMHRLHHKFRFARMTVGLPIEAPESCLLESAEALANLAGEAENWVFKPAYSRFASRTLIRPRHEALQNIRPSVSQPWVAQRYVAGREFCSYSLLVNGRLTAHACYHPRYRVGRGSGIYFEPGDPTAIRAFLEAFGKATGYSGQVAFDFIEMPDGRFHVLECNPRATSGVHLFDDQPDALVAALLNEGKHEVLLPTTTPRMVTLAMLLFAAPGHLIHSRFWQDFSVARDVVTRPGDRAPLLAQIPSFLEIVGRALSRQRGLLAAATADIEWDGQTLERIS